MKYIIDMTKEFAENLDKIELGSIASAVLLNKAKEAVPYNEGEWKFEFQNDDGWHSGDYWKQYVCPFCNAHENKTPFCPHCGAKLS